MGHFADSVGLDTVDIRAISFGLFHELFSAMNHGLRWAICLRVVWTTGFVNEVPDLSKIFKFIAHELSPIVCEEGLWGLMNREVPL